VRPLTAMEQSCGDKRAANPAGDTLSPETWSSTNPAASSCCRASSGSCLSDGKALLGERPLKYSLCGRGKAVTRCRAGVGMRTSGVATAARLVRRPAAAGKGEDALRHAPVEVRLASGIATGTGRVGMTNGRGGQAAYRRFCGF